MKSSYLFLLITILFIGCAKKDEPSRIRMNFNDNWKFHLEDDSTAKNIHYNDDQWRTLSVPHDWSIEGNFDKANATTTSEAALPAGTGWYRKIFTLPKSYQDKNIFIDFDGVFRDSKIWINGYFLGERPNGHISFRYDLTPYLHFGKQKNVIAVRVNNSLQPNARWYTGSGIERNVWLVVTHKVHVAHWGTYVTTPVVNEQLTEVNLQTNIRNTLDRSVSVSLHTIIYNEKDEEVAQINTENISLKDSITTIRQHLKINDPELWSVDDPYLYKVVTKIILDNKIVDEYETPLGIRSFHFDKDKGFFLNDKYTQIRGVCLHDGLGGLGAIVNVSAVKRRLKLLKEMGCNAIRTAHNPPSPELLDLCDQMGFLVMDEAFDVWKKKKVDYDYHIYWDQWHKKDLKDMIKRDRNHPSVFMWSIGNEIRAQFDSSGIPITKQLVGIVKRLDTTRPVTCALTETDPQKNFIYQSEALDVLGFNYKHNEYPKLPELFPNQKFIATETMSALETRGHYDMPSDSIMRWPESYKSDFKGNPDYTVPAYDNVSAYWGSTHEETLKAIRKCSYIAGLFVWSGIDYLGEPTPYPWPARSSYFGIIDLAGFPKDAYYLYQSLWTDKPVLHIFPHWNWKIGDTIDVWAYYNQADEVELFLNGRSLGTRSKKGDELHVMWRIKYEPGTLKAVSRKKGKMVLTREIKTAGKPAKIKLLPDRTHIKANGKDLSFITVKILDKEGNLAPCADNLLRFHISGPGVIAATNNGYQADLESFKASKHKAYNGLCLVVVQSKEKQGEIKLTASAEGLTPSSIVIESR